MTALQALRTHWPEYLIEGWALGTFMVSAGFVATALGSPRSVVSVTLVDPTLRNVIAGLAMGLTAIAIIYSPWGKRSGAHMNPAVTLTFWRLRKIASWDAFFYVASQFAGGITGVLVARILLRSWVAHPSVNFAVTVPGRYGVAVAFAAEIAISFILMSVILTVSNALSLARFTGLWAGALVATYIILEAPISGMSMNPARTFGSALSAHVWTALWIYFCAPPLGMLLAAELYVGLRGTN